MRRGLWASWLLLLCTSLIVVGCGAKKLPPTVVTIREPIEVKVPIPVPITAPPELLAPQRSIFPSFVPPTDPKAVAALTPEGVKQILAWLTENSALVAALRALLTPE